MAAQRERKNPLRRFHQLNGPGGINPAFAFGSQPNFKFDDLPMTVVALGVKHACYVPRIRLHYRGTLTNTNSSPLFIDRKFFTPMLCNSVQVQGTELGTPVSSTHSLGGYLDLDMYVRNGGRFATTVMNGSAGITIPATSGNVIPFEHFIDIFPGSNPAQHEGHHTSPLALFLKPGEIYVNCPTSFAGVDPSLSGLEATINITAHAVIDPDTELRIAHPGSSRGTRRTRATVLTLFSSFLSALIRLSRALKARPELQGFCGHLANSLAMLRARELWLNSRNSRPTSWASGKATT